MEWKMSNKMQYMVMGGLVIVMAICAYFFIQQDKNAPETDTDTVLEFKAEDADFWK
tara:strand:- start:694 stop:861 length:168 start_codon:yes stop_codon:yes gene_type:complete